MVALVGRGGAELQLVLLRAVSALQRRFFRLLS